MPHMLANLGEVWRKTSLIQRVILLAVLLACIGAATLLFNWVRKPNMSLLCAGLSPESASKIVDKLNDAGIPYEVKAGGTTILVPEQNVQEMKLEMAGQGLITGEQAGYGILDDEKIGASPFTQRINYIRAIEGEVAKTIQFLECVSSARVHIAKPESSVFTGSQARTSATVALKLRPGRRLTPANVTAITNLLAGSVEGLYAENVVVVDNYGNLLSGDAENELAKRAGTFLDYKSQVEQYLAQKAETMLASVLGPGKASVQVSAVVNTSSVDQTIEKYDQAGRVAATEEIKSSKSKTSAGGKETVGAGTDTADETIKTNYLVGKTVERKADLPGKIESVSVAVLADLSGQSGKEGKQAVTADDIKAIVISALGLSGDADITVKDAPFHTSETETLAQEVQDEGMFSKNFLLEMAKRGSLGILVIGALVLLKMFGGSKKTKGQAEEGSQQLALESMQGGQEERLLPAAMPASANPEQLKRSITQALQDNPDEVKRLFMSWAENGKGE